VETESEEEEEEENHVLNYVLSQCGEMRTLTK
jgi:hypothetical protein